MTTTPSSCSLTLEGCTRRQARLRDALAAAELDAALLTNPNHVFYFTNYWAREVFPRALLVPTGGPAILFQMCPGLGHVCADERVEFEGDRLGTLVDDPRHPMFEAARGRLRAAKRVGADGAAVPWILADRTVVDLGHALRAMRRHKDADEVAVIRRAIAGCEAAYRCARDMLAPGVTEVQMFAAMQAAAVNAVGEPIGEFGNDFQAGGGGGSPRDRELERGEIAIYDLGVVVRGCYSDNCRSFVVGGEPSDAQLDAHARVLEALEHVEATVRPGVSCRELYAAVHEMIDGHRGLSFPHHLGHGFGLQPHESPRLNPHWDDVFEVGDTFTAEPGLYGEELRGGLRLEQDYLVTDTGVERLTQFALDL